MVKKIAITSRTQGKSLNALLKDVDGYKGFKRMLKRLVKKQQSK